MAHQASAAKQAVVIGGSLGGLFAGLLLRSIRDVDIYERSPQDLDSRGGGIVLQPEVLRRSAALAFNMTPRSASSRRSGCFSTAPAASRGAFRCARC